MKRFISILSIFTVIICCTFTVFSFEIDGIDDSTEWEGAQSVLLFSDKESNSNCKIKFGSLMWSVNDSSLYICFNFIEPDLAPDNTIAGVIFSVEDSDFYTLTAAESVLYDSEKYRVEGALLINTSKGANCEVRIGFKHGLPDKINGKVRFIDSENSYSSIYDFCLEIEADDNNYYDDSYVNNTTKAAKTTTTKASTTKAAKTTKAQTTKTPKTTNKSDNDGFNLFDFLSSVETTKKESTQTTTKKKTSKTTKKANQTKKTVVTSVKIIEKVVEISGNTEPSETSTEMTVQSNTNNSPSTITTPQGKKYQMLTAIAGGIALVAISILGASGANRKAQKKAVLSNTETDNEELENIDTDESEDKLNNE